MYNKELMKLWLVLMFGYECRFYYFKKDFLIVFIWLGKLESL